MAEHDTGSMLLDDHRSLMMALEQAVGAGNVLDDEAAITRYAASTAARCTRPLAIVRPANRDEVVAVVDIARRHGVPIYPLSTGHNWGYGDACAVAEGQLIVELARMQRIVQVDAELAYAVIEPGVTQGQLSAFLREQGLPLWCDCTGAGPDTSLIGNILERGFGHSPYGNRSQHIAGMQIVLASGEVLATGFGHYAGSRVTHLFGPGLGPALDGLFTQSNFGVVVELGIWLMPAAPKVCQFITTVGRHQDLGPLIEALRPLRQDGTLRSVVHIGNDLRVVSGGATFPYDAAGSAGSARLPDAARTALIERSGAQAWTVSGCLYGSAAQVAAGRKAVQQALRKALPGGRARSRFFDRNTLAVGEKLARLLGRFSAGRALSARLALGRSMLSLAEGIPNGRFLGGAYWRRRGGLPATFPADANPAIDGCGLLWVSPMLPMRGAEALTLHALVAPIFSAHGFDMFVTLSLVNERAMCAVLTIAYDRDDAPETARAQACQRALFAAVMAAGYIPYRVGVETMGALDPGNDVYWKVVARIKAALDPLGSIAPGRYEPATARRLAAESWDRATAPVAQGTGARHA